MVEEMIKTVRAALEPGADAVTKQQAAAILRGVLGMLEGAPTSGPNVVPPAAQPADTDLLGRILEYARPYLPEEALQQMPRFRVPLIDFNRSK